jgi:hypothetical protein
MLWVRLALLCRAGRCVPRPIIVWWRWSVNFNVRLLAKTYLARWPRENKDVRTTHVPHNAFAKMTSNVLVQVSRPIKATHLSPVTPPPRPQPHQQH